MQIIVTKSPGILLILLQSFLFIYIFFVSFFFAILFILFFLFYSLQNITENYYNIFPERNHLNLNRRRLATGIRLYLARSWLLSLPRNNWLLLVRQMAISVQVLMGLIYSFIPHIIIFCFVFCCFTDYEIDRRRTHWNLNVTLCETLREHFDGHSMRIPKETEM